MRQLHCSPSNSSLGVREASPMPRRHLPVLDGLRGLAIIAILLRHSAYIFQAHGQATRWFLPIMQFGMWGVDLFFVLSGFLITSILLDTRTAANRARSFYGRRILRIFPLYYLAIALVMFAEWHFPGVRQGANLQNSADHLSYLFYFQNWIPLWHHGNYPESFIGHFWSLAVEEQFYLIWPAIVWHLTKEAISRLCVAALLVSLALRIMLVTHFGHGIWVYAFTITRSDGLFVGSALAVVYALKGRVSNRLLGTLAGTGAAALAAIAIRGPVNQIWLSGTQMALIGIPAIALLSGALIVFCLQFAETSFARFFRARWIRNFGKYSYGMYVWHFPIYYWIERAMRKQLVVFPLPVGQGILYVALLVVVSYCAAWLSFHCYEQWFLRLKTHFEPVFGERDLPRTVPVWVKDGVPG
jgi:peptidoglycan/LPS O-acetylase OafA/YrhL